MENERIRWYVFETWKNAIPVIEKWHEYQVKQRCSIVTQIWGHESFWNVAYCICVFIFTVKLIQYFHIHSDLKPFWCRPYVHCKIILVVTLFQSLFISLQQSTARFIHLLTNILCALMRIKYQWWDRYNCRKIHQNVNQIGKTANLKAWNSKKNDDEKTGQPVSKKSD